jgi:hypothetical protein
LGAHLQAKKDKELANCKTAKCKEDIEKKYDAISAANDKKCYEAGRVQCLKDVLSAGFEGYSAVDKVNNLFTNVSLDKSQIQDWSVNLGVEGGLGFMAGFGAYLGAEFLPEDALDGSLMFAGALGKGLGTIGGKVFGKLDDVVEFVIESSQLDRKFKHAPDFGVVTTKKNPSTVAQFGEAIQDHLTSPNTIQKGTYLPTPNSVVYYNPTTNNVVVLKPTGEFVTGFKIRPGSDQFANYFKNGALR